MNHALADLVKYQSYIISVRCVRWLRSVAILCLIFTSLSLVLSGQSMAQSDWSEPVSQWRGHWYVATPSVLGFDPLQLLSTIDSIGKMSGVYGFLLIRKGYLVAEQYWREGDVTKAHNMKSASKSVISSLVGIAIERGHFKLDQPIIDLLPQSKLLLDVKDKKQITVRHLLTMTSGLEPTSYQSYNSWVASSDWIEEALKAPLISVPGTTYHYSTANSHLLSAILAGNTGMSTRAFAEKELFNPMDVTISGWETDPDGIHVGGNNLSILPRDMAKFGQLYLDHGRWQERQLIPKWWVDASTAASNNGEHETYGNYGFLWWSQPLDQGSFAAVGYGGQYVVVSPEHDTVMVVISELESKGDLWETKLFDLLNYGILGSLIDPSMPPKVIAAVTTTKVNLRSIPSKQGEVLRAISAGTRVLLSKRDTQWVFGRVGQHSGWLHAQFIDQLELASAKASTVAVASEPKDSLLQLLKEKQSLEIELSDSRTKVISFENQLSLVQTKYRKSKDELISLSEASEGKSRQMIKLKQKLGIAENTQLRVEEAFAGFNTKIEGLNQALTQLESVKRKNTLNLEAKDSQFKQLKTQHVEKQTELEKLRLENGSRGQLISDYKTEKAEVDARYSDLVATAEVNQQDVTRLKAELLQVESDRQLTQNELAESQKQAGNFEKAVAAAQHSKKLISAELALSGEQLNITKDSLAELRSAEQLVQTKYRKSKDELISLSEASEGKSRQMIKLKQKLGIADNRQLRVEEAFAGFNAKIVGLNQALTELESVKRKNTLNLEAKGSQFKQLKTQYVEKQTELEKLRLVNGSQGQLISDYETEKAQVAARYGDLVATAELNQQDVTRLKAELLQVESDRQLTQNELVESQTQTEQLQKAVTAAQQSEKLISAELALSGEQLNITKSSLVELRSAQQLIVARYNKSHVELDDVKQSFGALQTEKQQLADELIENKVRIANLNQTLDDELVTKQLIADELTVATTQITQLDNILYENQVNLQSLITERDIRWAKIVTLEKIRADEQAENQSISNKMQVDSKHIASLEESLDQTHGDLQIVVSKLENSQTQVGMLEQSFEKLRASNQLTAIEQLSNQKKMGSLKNELSQAKLENQFVSSSLEASNRVNVILEEMLVKLKLDMKFRVSELAASRTWSEKLQKSLTAVWDQQQFDTAALNDGEKKIQNLKKYLSQTRVEKNQLSTRLATNEASISHFEASLASAELEKNNLSEKLEASQTRADKLEKSLTQSQNAHRLDAGILIGLRGNQQNQSVQIETLSADLVREQTENNSLLIEYAEWQGKIVNFKDKLALLQSDNQASESMLVASYDEISELEKLLDNYKGGVAELINLLGQSAANVSNATIQRVLNDSGVVLLIDQLMSINVQEELQPLAFSSLNGGSADDLHLAEIERFVRDWAKSWSQKNVSNYFAFYGSNFRPGDGLNYEQWKQLRRKRLSQPKFIEVSISDLKVTKLVSGNLKATFGQVYRTESYRDQIVKTLEMVQNNSGWKIISEESL